ncbi:hypothetical protein [Actinoallomurus sp. CA-150999]|uniref:hypothetical protein n=1 Tax=Actinoallomurus sp. CA-150999 TaxID=3239887 RepID=UPI003D8FC7EA
MRDFSAGRRIADWYHARREELAADLAADLAAGSSEMSPEDPASLAMAISRRQAAWGLPLEAPTPPSTLMCAPLT